MRKTETVHGEKKNKNNDDSRTGGKRRNNKGMEDGQICREERKSVVSVRSPVSREVLGLTH